MYSVKQTEYKGSMVLQSKIQRSMEENKNLKSRLLKYGQKCKGNSLEKGRSFQQMVLKQSASRLKHTHTHTHTHIYIIINLSLAPCKKFPKLKPKTFRRKPS